MRITQNHSFLKVVNWIKIFFFTYNSTKRHTHDSAPLQRRPTNLAISKTQSNLLTVTFLEI